MHVSICQNAMSFALCLPMFWWPMFGLEYHQCIYRGHSRNPHES